MAYEFEQLHGRHRVVYRMDIDLVSMKQRTTAAEEDDSLGYVEISEKQISCPLGSFAIEAVKLHPKMPAWFLKLDPSSGILRCSILRGKTKRRGLTMDTETHMYTFSFNIPQAK